MFYSSLFVTLTCHVDFIISMTITTSMTSKVFIFHIQTIPRDFFVILLLMSNNFPINLCLHFCIHQCYFCLTSLYRYTYCIVSIRKIYYVCYFLCIYIFFFCQYVRKVIFFSEKITAKCINFKVLSHLTTKVLLCLVMLSALFLLCSFDL